MLSAGHQQAALSVHYATSRKHSLVLLRVGEIIVRNMSSWLKLLTKLSLLHLVGCLYYYINDVRSHKHQMNGQMLAELCLCICLPLCHSYLFCNIRILWRVCLSHTQSTSLFFSRLPVSPLPSSFSLKILNILCVSYTRPKCSSSDTVTWNVIVLWSCSAWVLRDSKGMCCVWYGGAAGLRCLCVLVCDAV